MTAPENRIHLRRTVPPHSPVHLPAGENLVPEQAGEGEEDQQEEAAAGSARRRGAPQPQRLLAGSRGGGGRRRAGPHHLAVTAAGDSGAGTAGGHSGSGRAGPGGAVGAAPPMHYTAPRGRPCVQVYSVCVSSSGGSVCIALLILLLLLCSGAFFYPGICYKKRGCCLSVNPRYISGIGPKDLCNVVGLMMNFSRKKKLKHKFFYFIFYFIFFLQP